MNHKPFNLMPTVMHTFSIFNHSERHAPGPALHTPLVTLARACSSERARFNDGSTSTPTGVGRFVGMKSL